VTALRVLVVDDESIARERAVRLLRAIPGIEIAGECASGEQVIAALEHADVDVILLDIQMPGLTGLDTAALLPEDGPYVVFATAHPEHAVRAFDLGATDYLLKPLEASRLVRAIDRARAHLERPRPSVPATTRLAVPTRSGIVLVAPSEISHAVWDGAIVTIHTSARNLLADTSLQELAAKLPSETFERVHRRAIVNLDHVAVLEPTEAGGYIARLSGGAAVEVSRQAARRLRRRLGLAG
jgi:two-component system, LytTR family, response regulator